MLQQGIEGRPVNFRQTLDKRAVLLHSLPLVLFICGIHTDKKKKKNSDEVEVGSTEGGYFLFKSFGI